MLREVFHTGFEPSSLRVSYGANESGLALGGRPAPLPAVQQAPSQGWHGASDAAGPTMADEIAFLNGVDSANNVAATSFWTWNYDRPATYATESVVGKWGADHTSSDPVTINYLFNAASGWSALEKGVITSCLDLWSAISNIQFNLVTHSADSQLTFKRGGDGSAYEYDFQDDSGGAGTIGDSTLFTKTKAVISVDTSVPGFGPIDGSFTAFGGYVWGTLVHEIGHAIGLGHAGPYNGSANPLTQQFSAYDTLIWSTMSYFEPHQHAKYSADYPVNVNWGISPDGYTQTPTTWMPLDILAVQQLYGAPASSTMNGGQTFGFNCDIAGGLGDFFDFAVNVNPILTIWSAGVDNTLDLSGFNTPSIVDLHGGTFSSCDGLTNNIAIAAGTVVETAIGGRGSDTFTANALDDTLIGNKGGDTFKMGGTLTSADAIDGGRGLDALTLNGDYAGVVFAAATMKNVETISLGAGHDYSLTLDNANVRTGHTLTVNGSSLGAADTLNFDGSAEQGASLVLLGGAANDVLAAGHGADVLNGGAGNDVLKYGVAGQSTGARFDTVQGFDFDSADRFDLPVVVMGRNNNVLGGTLTTAGFDLDMATAINPAKMGAGHALLFAPSAGDYMGSTFLIVDGNGIAGYQGGADFVFRLDGTVHQHNFNVADFI